MSCMFNYWGWLFQGSGGRPGFRRLFDRWLAVHVVVGVIVSLLVKVDLPTAANSVLLPLAAIFVGLSFAWSGNAQALMQSPEINQLADHHEGGFAEYAYTFQTAILVILVTLVLWGLIGLRVFAWFESPQAGWIPRFFLRVVLFTLSSMTLRECWQVVLGSQWMLLAQREIRKRAAEGRKKDGGGE